MENPEVHSYQQLVTDRPFLLDYIPRPDTLMGMVWLAFRRAAEKKASLHISTTDKIFKVNEDMHQLSTTYVDFYSSDGKNPNFHPYLFLIRRRTGAESKVDDIDLGLLTITKEVKGEVRIRSKRDFIFGGVHFQFNEDIFE